jgi:peptidoglycan/LPS O-acetylase OafA/YrhL
VDASKSRPIKPKIEGLEAMRFFSSLHIVIIHFYLYPTPIPNQSAPKYYAADTADVQWYSFESWGRAQLTMFFMLSGFVLTYVNTDKIKKLETYAFWSRRVSRLYPMFVLSCVASISLFPKGSYTVKQVITVLLGAEAWFAWAYNASVNTPAWSIGVFLLLYLIFPTALRIIVGRCLTIT